MAISSFGRAFAYLIGVRPRMLLRKDRNLKSNSQADVKVRFFNLNQAIESESGAEGIQTPAF